MIGKISSWLLYCFVVDLLVSSPSPHLLMAEARVASSSSSIPKTFVWDGAALAAARERVMVHSDPELMPAVKKITAAAAELFGQGENWTVMAKAMTPPSGTKHDYESIGPYWWPCNQNVSAISTINKSLTAVPLTGDVHVSAACNKTSGLPWVRHDGVHNPVTDHFDSAPNGHMQNAVKTFSIAYFFTGNESFAEEAVKTLKRWFLDADTKMNPNLNFGQMIPGVCDGRGIGIIDTASWYALVDSIQLLDGSAALDASTRSAMTEWFKEYATWLHTSRNGKDESNAKNNHGTWYDAQIQSFALMSGLTDIAHEVAKMVPDKRIKVEIKPDGQMPMEEARTKSKSYCTFNLRALFNLARVSSFSGLSLWNYTSSDGSSIRKAFDWMVPYAVDHKAWPFKQIADYSWGEMFELFRRASIEYENPDYEKMISSLPDIHEDDVINLLYPRVYNVSVYLPPKPDRGMPPSWFGELP
ncbi:uncharacterized protein LOC135819283 [Sycon ciliatum]|uniref:uncharacterized protein LOC135819283 n=1 Tax=Sycon ciliatum TaxID=27933 RepID=UPI0031F70CDE